MPDRAGAFADRHHPGSHRFRAGQQDADHHGEVTHFQALTATLSATVGLGNIAGVPIALTIGGLVSSKYYVNQIETHNYLTILLNENGLLTVKITFNEEDKIQSIDYIKSIVKSSVDNLINLKFLFGPM